jgi:hypothetical protein
VAPLTPVFDASGRVSYLRIMTIPSRLAFAAAILLALPAAAQAEPRFGVRFGYYTEAEDPFIGAEMLFRVVPEIYFNPNVEAVLVDSGRYFTVNGDFHYDFYSARRTFLWVGAGLAVLNFNPEGPAEGDTDFGLNLLGGVGARRGRVIPYAQAKVILKSDTEFVIGVGLRF